MSYQDEIEGMEEIENIEAKVEHSDNRKMDLITSLLTVTTELITLSAELAKYDDKCGNQSNVFFKQAYKWILEAKHRS